MFLIRNTSNGSDVRLHDSTDQGTRDGLGGVPAPAVRPDLPASSAPGRSSARALKNQGSKSFEARVAKGKAAALDPPVASASGSGIPQGSPLAPSAMFSRSELEAYTHIGLTVPVIGDKAGEYRARATDNETRMVLYVTNVERIASKFYRDTGRRHEELTKLMYEVKELAERRSAPSRSMALSIDLMFLAVHKAVGENRIEIQKLMSSFQGVDSLRAEVADLRGELWIKNTVGSVPFAPFHQNGSISGGSVVSNNLASSNQLGNGPISRVSDGHPAYEHSHLQGGTLRVLLNGLGLLTIAAIQ